MKKLIEDNYLWAKSNFILIRTEQKTRPIKRKTDASLEGCVGLCTHPELEAL